jgi:hypothetical protein
MPIIEKIPTMKDGKLSVLFANAMGLLDDAKRSGEAESVIKAIEAEWDARRQAAKFGEYKADPEEGVLKALGYSVGNEGAKTPVRRKILDFVLARSLPPVGSPAYMDEWGEPGSSKRFDKLSQVLRSLIIQKRNFGNMDKAVSEWEDDLSWLAAKHKA